MKRRILGLISTLIGIVLAVVTVEIAATIWLTLEDGRYVSAAELFDRAQNTYVRDATKGKNCGYVDTLSPHPYVAFVHHADPPCGMPNVNNVGLFGEDFPTEKRADRFTVLLVGGSVASQLGQFAAPPARRYLEEELNRQYVSPNGKPFLVLNGGDGAWKQPQSFILFALYAGSIDAVVTLDGFNEHFLFVPVLPLRLELPAGNFLDVNPVASEERFGAAAIGWLIGRMATSLRHAPILEDSHAAYMIVRGLEVLARRQENSTSQNKTTLNSMFAMPNEIASDPELRFRVQLDLYRKYARAIEAVAIDNGVRTAYFLQPIPAYGKVLTDEEKRNAGDLSYGDIYRRMVNGMMALRDRGMQIFDLGDIYQDETGRIYADAIHCYQEPSPTLESRGYSIMAARMAVNLAKVWNLQHRLQSNQ